MKPIAAALLLTLAAAVASPASAAPDAHFDGSANTVTGDTAVLGAAGPKRSLALTTGNAASRSLDNGQPPPAADGGSGGLGEYKNGLLWGAGAGAFGALLAFGLGMGPVGIAGLGLIGAGVGLGLMGKSPMEKLGGAGLAGAGMGLGLAVALGATPFGLPMLALAAVGAAAAAGATYFFGK